MRYQFRAHHLMCTLGFRGRGYSPSFVKNFWEIIDGLEKGNPQLEIVPQTDSICSPCPHNEKGICDKNAKIRKLDLAHAEALGIQEGEHLSWSEAKQRVRDRVTLEKFHQICSTCSWKNLGFCESALKQLGVK